MKKFLLFGLVILFYYNSICLSQKTPTNYWVSPYGLINSKMMKKSKFDTLQSKIVTKTSLPSFLSIPNTEDINLLDGSNFIQSENSVFISPIDDDINNIFRILNSNNSDSWPNEPLEVYGANELNSTNAGNSWIGDQYGPIGNNSGDPAVIISRSGRIFVGYMNGTNQRVAFSDDYGQYWDYVDVTSHGSGSGLDKNHLWVDNSCHSQYKGYIYDSWSNWNDEPINIEISRSTDNGDDWSSYIILSDNLEGVWKNSGVNIQTGPNGEVYVSWAVFSGGSGNETGIAFTKSLNGGATWSDSEIIFSINGHYSRMFGGNKTMKHNSFPSMSVNIQNGDIYIVWTEYILDCSETDIYFRKSTDLGETWSSPIRVNQDESCNDKDQWFPWIACDEISGALVCIFYDSRNYQYNDGAETFIAISYDGGNSWDDALISDDGWDADAINKAPLASGYAGDYIGLDCRYCYAIPVWSDKRAGNMLAYTSPFTLECPENLSLCYANIWEEALYSVSNDITVAGTNCDYKVTDEGMCVMEAGHEIVLKPGFHADNGSYFHAKIIDNCETHCRKVDEFIEKGGCPPPFSYFRNIIQNTILEQDYSENKLNIFPNPSDNKFYIEYKIEKYTNTRFIIYSFVMLQMEME